MPTLRPRFVLLPFLFLALAGCGADGGGLAGGAGSERLNSTGRWFTDVQGRVVILHGVNVVAKTEAGSPSQQGFGADDAAALAAEGFNAFRLGIYHDVVAPAPGEFNDAYIADLVATARILSDAGLHVLVDWHQDGFAPSLGGRGLAEWMVITDGVPSVPSPQFQVNYLQNPALQRAFDNLYANTPAADGTGLADHFAAALARAATQFRTVPRLLGYDLINEPWPGTPYASCANPLGCPLFDQMVLAPFYQRLTAAIREADPDGIVFYEPHVLFSFGADTWLPAPNDPQAGFSFHNYCLEPGQFPGLDVFPVPLDAHCSTLEGLVFANAEAYGEQSDVALIDSEWGFTTDAAYIERVAGLLDDARMPFLFWAYNEQIIIDPQQPATPDNLRQEPLGALARAYPRAVAGEPLAWTFDPDSARFELTYITGRVDGSGDFPPGAETEVFLPPRHYPQGYRVSVEGATVSSAPDAPRLTLASLPGSTEIRVVVERE